MKLGEKLDKRPKGRYLVCGIGPTVGGFSYTALENSSGHRIIKKAESAMGKYDAEYYEYIGEQAKTPGSDSDS